MHTIYLYIFPWKLGLFHGYIAIVPEEISLWQLMFFSLEGRKSGFQDFQTEFVAINKGQPGLCLLWDGWVLRRYWLAALFAVLLLVLLWENHHLFCKSIRMAKKFILTYGKPEQTFGQLKSFLWNNCIVPSVKLQSAKTGFPNRLMECEITSRTWRVWTEVFPRFRPVIICLGCCSVPCRGFGNNILAHTH